MIRRLRVPLQCPHPDGKNTVLLAHFYFPQNSLNPDELQVVWVGDISRVCNEKAMLVDFVRTIAEGKQPNAVEAAEVLSWIVKKIFSDEAGIVRLLNCLDLIEHCKLISLIINHLRSFRC